MQDKRHFFDPTSSAGIDDVAIRRAVSFNLHPRCTIHTDVSPSLRVVIARTPTVIIIPRNCLVY